MTKAITILVDYPATIKAFDSEGQYMHVTREAARTVLSDNDNCHVVSARPGEKPMNGRVTWGKAFGAIADFMNATELDGDWNH